MLYFDERNDLRSLGFFNVSEYVDVYGLRTRFDLNWKGVELYETMTGSKPTCPSYHTKYRTQKLMVSVFVLGKSLEELAPIWIFGVLENGLAIKVCHVIPSSGQFDYVNVPIPISGAKRMYMGFENEEEIDNFRKQRDQGEWFVLNSWYKSSDLFSR